MSSISNGFYHGYETQEVKFFVHHMNWNDASMLKLKGNVIGNNLEVFIYWSITFSSPQAELMIFAILISIITTLYFGSTTASPMTSLVTLSLYKLPF